MPFSSEVLGLNPEVAAEQVDVADDNHIVASCRKNRFGQRILILCAAAMPEGYATRVVDLLNHCKYESPRVLAMALMLATPAQERALAQPIW